MFDTANNNKGLWEKLNERHQKNVFNRNANNSALYNSLTNQTQGNTSKLGSSSVFGQYGADANNENPSGASSILNAIGTFTNGNNGGGFGGFGGGSSSSGGGSVPWAAIGAVAKGGYNAITKQDDQDYSDTEESIIYPLQGASLGAQFGPWGAAGGALYGLGYSFKDDMGLKDSNFFTKLLYPIDLGGDYSDWISL